MTKCDCCEKTAYYLIKVCKDHLNVIDKFLSRKEKHSIKMLTDPIKLVRLESERVIELTAKVDELTKKLNEKKAE